MCAMFMHVHWEYVLYGSMYTCVLCICVVCVCHVRVCVRALGSLQFMASMCLVLLPCNFTRYKQHPPCAYTCMNVYTCCSRRVLNSILLYPSYTLVWSLTKKYLLITQVLEVGNSVHNMKRLAAQ